MSGSGHKKRYTERTWCVCNKQHISGYHHRHLSSPSSGNRREQGAYRKTSLYHYTYNWPIKDMNGNNQTAQAVIFGLGSMFNHSTQEQNVGWMRDLRRQIITYRALRDIRRGEELCISYGSHLTFKDADPVPSTPPEEELEQLRMMEPY
ncbi:hypothetical protein P3342_009406 [Pyrenophora teres f. teres]|nr:hypothetical protein P3342_009406 [Pyrenophora teres f. teres]